MFTPPNMSRVMCHVSHVTCHMSHVFLFVFLDKVVKLIGGGSVINGPIPSSLESESIRPVQLSPSAAHHPGLTEETGDSEAMAPRPSLGWPSPSRALAPSLSWPLSTWPCPSRPLHPGPSPSKAPSFSHHRCLSGRLLAPCQLCSLSWKARVWPNLPSLFRGISAGLNCLIKSKLFDSLGPLGRQIWGKDRQTFVSNQPIICFI